MNACVLNNTVIGVSHVHKKSTLFHIRAFKIVPSLLHVCVFVQAGEKLMMDMCTQCECTVEDGAVRKYRLSCRSMSCPTCPMVTNIPSLFCIITLILCHHNYFHD